MFRSSGSKLCCSSVRLHGTGRYRMITGRSLQELLDVVRLWWLLGWQVNGQYALKDDGRREPLRCCSAYFSERESQGRGAAHLHVMIWHPAPGEYVMLRRRALPTAIPQE